MVQRGEDFGFALEPREASASAATDAGSTLIATLRFRLVSVARYTSPMPPAPICSVSKKTPRRLPGVRANVGDYMSGVVGRSGPLTRHPLVLAAT